MSDKEQKNWASFFANCLGHPIIEGDEVEALNKAMEEAFNTMLKTAKAEKKTVAIRVLNDTGRLLTVRLLPPNTSPSLKPKNIAPLKMTVVYVEGNKVFLKVWDNNTLLLCEDTKNET